MQNNSIEEDEYIDVVDENDNVVGRKLRSKSRIDSVRKNTRVVHGFLVNSRWKIWIPRRTVQKHSYPLGLDFSFSGYVQSGETYEQALKREVEEEIGFDLDKVDWRQLGYFSPYKDGTSTFMKVFEIRSDKTPDYNKDDFCEAFWISPEELLKRIEAGESSKKDIPKLVKLFYLK